MQTKSVDDTITFDNCVHRFNSNNSTLKVYAMIAKTAISMRTDVRQCLFHMVQMCSLYVQNFNLLNKYQYVLACSLL